MALFKNNAENALKKERLIIIFKKQRKSKGFFGFLPMKIDCAIMSKEIKEDNMESLEYKNYISPFNSKYAGNAMRYIFSPEKKYRVWRKLWVALAEAEKDLGLEITDAQIEEMKNKIEDIDYEMAQDYMKLLEDEVSAHAATYSRQCPLAAGIINLGGSTAYISDNADLISFIEALQLVKKKLVNIMDRLYTFSDRYRDLPTLAFTHMQATDPTTVGKRASLWLQDMVFDFENLEFVSKNIKLLGVKGISGTQRNFLELFEGNFKKVRKLDSLVCKKIGYRDYYYTTGQCYPRKLDSQILSLLSGIAQSAHKFSNDIRLLNHLKEVDEPLGKMHVGFSTAFKRNPIKVERMASLSKYVISASVNPAMVAATQWLEKSQDDSASRRIVMAESFLAIDGILDTYLDVIENLTVYPKVIEKNLRENLPLVACDVLLEWAFANAKNKENLYEKFTEHAKESIRMSKEEGRENDFLERVAQDPAFGITLDQLEKLLKPNKFVGSAPEQTEEFLFGIVAPILSENKKHIVKFK